MKLSTARPTRQLLVPLLWFLYRRKALHFTLLLPFFFSGRTFFGSRIVRMYFFISFFLLGFVCQPSNSCPSARSGGICVCPHPLRYEILPACLDGNYDSWTLVPSQPSTTHTPCFLLLLPYSCWADKHRRARSPCPCGTVRSQLDLTETGSVSTT